MIGQSINEAQKAGMWTITGNLIGSQETNLHFTCVRGVVVEGNFIYSGHRGNVLLEKCHSIVLGANVFGHNPDYKELELCTGVRLVDCESCTLTGLHIQDARSGQNSVKDALPLIDRRGLIELIRCHRINLTGVQILEGTPYGMYFEDCSRTMVTGCSIDDTRAQPLMKASVKTERMGSGNIIQGCRFNRPIDVSPNVHVANNLIETAD